MQLLSTGMTQISHTYSWSHIRDTFGHLVTRGSVCVILHTLYGTAVPLYLELLVAIWVEEVSDLLVVDLDVGHLDVVLRVPVPLQVLLALEDVHNRPRIGVRWLSLGSILISSLHYLKFSYIDQK